MLEFVISEGGIDPNRVGVYGWSYGGYLAFLAVTREETFKFAASALLSGGSDWDIGVITSDTPIYSISLAGRAPWNLSKDDIWNRNCSPVWHMANNKIRMRVLILQGEKDDRGRITNAMAFHQGCLAHDIP